MRIVGGQYKGRQFNPGKKFSSRPTTDMAKESLFNVLQNYIDFEAIKALDLFSGTGSISFELVSRGCLDVTSVELNYSHYQFIKETAQQLKTNAIHPVKANVFQFLKNNQQSFDFIFADPPYDHPQFEEVPVKVLEGEALAPNGCFVLEHSKFYNFESFPEWKETRNYGSVHFSFFFRNGL